MSHKSSMAVGRQLAVSVPEGEKCTNEGVRINNTVRGRKIEVSNELPMRMIVLCLKAQRDARGLPRLSYDFGLCR